MSTDQGGNPLELLRARSSGVTDRYWYKLDGWGNVVALTDGSGAVVDRYSYDLWGEVKLAAGVRCARCRRRPNRGRGGRPWPNVRWRICVY